MKVDDRMKKKIFFLLLGVFLVAVILFLFPLIRNKIEYQKLDNKVILVNRFLSSDCKYIDVEKTIKQKETHLKKLEKGLNQYLKEIISTYNVSNTIIEKNTSNIVFSEEELDDVSKIQKSIETLQEENRQLSKEKESLEVLLKKKTQNQFIDFKHKKEYDSLLKKVNYSLLKKYLNTITNHMNLIDKDIMVLEFLKNHFDTWRLSDHKVEFQKRSIYDEFCMIEISNSKKNISFQLVDDKDGPIITANDITIYVNNEVNLSQKVHCEDLVDGEVDCVLDGSYNKSSVGTYPIKVTAKDKNGNMSEKTISIKVIAKVNQKPYIIHVIRNQNVVVVYGLDENGEYTEVIKSFICSTGAGNATPVGTFQTTKGTTWGLLYGGVWGQYTTRIVSDILFHSVPYFSKNKGDLEWEEYNKLGTQASMGCVRLTVRDARWIFNHCPAGTTVKIYDGDLPSEISKPGFTKIDGNSPNRGWDPTDEDSNNPW